MWEPISSAYKELPLFRKFRGNDLSVRKSKVAVRICQPFTVILRAVLAMDLDFEVIFHLLKMVLILFCFKILNVHEIPVCKFACLLSKI